MSAAAGEDDRITRSNPWWFSPDWTGEDPHLRRLAAQPVRLPARVVRDLDLGSAGVHTLRGPRQVGKSTDLKLLVQRALGEGFAPREIVYLTLDLLEDQPAEALANIIDRARHLAAPKERCLVLLDEVTAVRGWQAAVKDLWDRGVIDRDVVICTGSSAVDLAHGTAERLPGRRGAGRDHLVLPQSFDVFAGAMIEGLPESPRSSLRDLLREEGRDALRDVQIYGPRLLGAMARYLRFGGLPAAVAEAATGAQEASEGVRRILWDSIAREILRKGASEAAARALLERVVRSLGSKTSWSQMAREMDVSIGRGGTIPPDQRTLRQYIEFLASGYFLLIVYFWRRDSGSASLSRQKKVYFGDPLLHSIALELSPGLRFDEAAAVENAVALALYRRYESQADRTQGSLEPQDIHVWETSKGGEVDFVCGARRSLEAAEVKYRNRIDRRDLAGLRRSFPGRPIVIATKSELEMTPDHALIPAHLLLWALGD